jgi:hypothetical protein
MVPITVHIAGFRGAHRDAALRDSVQPPELGPEVQPPIESDEADPCPVPEDDECFEAPDAQSKEETINKFLDDIPGIEGQECSGFKDIHRFLNQLPVPEAGPSGKRAPPGTGWTPATIENVDNAVQRGNTRWHLALNWVGLISV